MFKLYTLNIANNKSCYTKNAYKIFFIILELIRNYQLSSLLIILLKKRIIHWMVRFFIYPWSGAELNPAPVSFFESGRWPYS